MWFRALPQFALMCYPKSVIRQTENLPLIYFFVLFVLQSHTVHQTDRRVSAANLNAIDK